VQAFPYNVRQAMKAYRGQARATELPSEEEWRDRPLGDLRQENANGGGGRYGRGKKADSGKKCHDRQPSLSARRTMSGTGLSLAAVQVQRQN